MRHKVIGFVLIGPLFCVIIFSPLKIASLLVSEILDGISGCGVRCGIIGEVGCSWPLCDSERKSLLASVQAHRKTGGHNLVSNFTSFQLCLLLLPFSSLN